jgi:DNA-binding GntR family transcriptional regulator/transposase
MIERAPMSSGPALRIQRSSTVEWVVTALSEAIFSGRLPAGTALREWALADELDVSRNTVREALRVLAADGLVRHVINHGAYVASISAADIDDIYGAREVIELAGICAIQEGEQESVLAELEAHVDELERAVAARDASAALTHDRAFHRAVVAATQNDHLLSAFVVLQDELRLALSLHARSSTTLGRAEDDHRELFEAIRSGSKQIAEEALKGHLAVGRRELHRLRDLVTAGDPPTPGGRPEPGGPKSNVISDQDRRTLESWTRSSTISAGHRERAEIVLAIADGSSVSGAARTLGVSRPTVIKWRDRFAAAGVDGLGDQPRSGRPKTVDDAQIIAATLERPPASLGVRCWSSRLLGRHLGVGDATVARAWRTYRIQPRRAETFKFSAEPEFEADVRDVVGLYLGPPENAIVISTDEQSQREAIDRTATLVAALEVATGRAVDRHGKGDVSDFLERVAEAYPRRRLHVVLDHTHDHDDIDRWLAENPRITLHFTPTSGSWLNLVEVFFGIVTRGGSFDTVRQPATAIRAFAAAANDRSGSFAWIAPAVK